MDLFGFPKSLQNQLRRLPTGIVYRESLRNDLISSRLLRYVEVVIFHLSCFMQVSLTGRIVDMIWFDQQIHTYSYIGYTKPVYYGSKWRYTRDHTIAHIQYYSTLFYHQQFGGGKKNERFPNCSLRHQTYWKAAREAADLIRGANPDPKHVAVTCFQMKTTMVAYRCWDCIIDSFTVCIASCLHS